MMSKAKEFFEFFQTGYASENGPQGLYNDVLIDGCYDLERLAYKVEEWIAEDINKVVSALNAAGLNPEQKEFIAEYLERFR